jgi:hypothetical protein
MIQTPLPHLAPPGVDWNSVFSDVVAPVVGIAILLLVGATMFRWLLNSPVGEALAERLRRRGSVAGDETQRVAALEEQVAQLSAHLSEFGERLDFAERVLAERRDRKLGAGQ